MKQKAVIFDIDGTLADCDHRLHFIQQLPKDWGSFFKASASDGVNYGISNLFWFLAWCKQTGKKIELLIVTARPETYKLVTEQWLVIHELHHYKEIFFRKEGDFRNDDIIKKEIYKEHIKDKYEVMFVVEDRSRVVKMWRKLGLTCLQCAEGGF